MIHFRYSLITRKAFVPLAILIILALIVHYNFGIAMSIWLWMLAALTMYIFRDPKREVPPVPLAIVAPIDGTVASVDDVIDPFLNRHAKRIQMLGSVTGPFTVRSVTEGKVQKQWFGTLPDGGEEGIYSATGVPQYAQWTQSDEGDDVITCLSPKFLSSAVGCSASSGERIGQGKACTFILFGADVEVLLAENTRVDVKAGDKIKAGSSIIATLIH